MDYEELAHHVGEVCRLSGEFTLRSGQVSTTYFDKYLFESDPVVLREITTHAARLIPSDTEVLAGLELGGIPIVTALSLATGLPATFVRKEAKRYGTAQLAEGALVSGHRVLVIEDVITTGGQVVLSTVALRELGAIARHVLCIIDRSDGDHRVLDDVGISVLSLFSRDVLER